MRGALLVGRRVASRYAANATATVVTDGGCKIRVGATVTGATGLAAQERSASQWEAANTEADGAPSETGCGWGSGQWAMDRGGGTDNLQMGQVSGALADAHQEEVEEVRHAVRRQGRPRGTRNGGGGGLRDRHRGARPRT